MRDGKSVRVSAPMSSSQDLEPIELLIQFLGYSAPKIPKGEHDLGIQELAVAIAQTGREGADSLLAFAPFADELRLRAILLAMTCVNEVLSEHQRDHVCALARR